MTRMFGRLHYYILGGEDGHEPVGVEDFMEWALWWEEAIKDFDANLRVDKTIVEPPTRFDEDGNALDGVYVSSVFLGIDHNWFDRGPAIVFETMIFGGAMSDHQWRAATWQDAQENHRRAVALAWEAKRQGLKGPRDLD